jgi:hypothetical protein
LAYVKSFELMQIVIVGRTITLNINTTKKRIIR